jgi:hypothetical protein
MKKKVTKKSSKRQIAQTIDLSELERVYGGQRIHADGTKGGIIKSQI